MRASRTAIATVSTAVSVATLALSSCGHSKPETGWAAALCAAPRFAPPYSVVDPCSADAVLTSAAVAIFSYRPAEQPDAAEAFSAATPLIAPTYVDRIGAAADVLAPVTEGTWERWTSLHVHVVATALITLDDHPPDTTGQVSRVVAITQRAGDEPPRFITAYMRVSRDSTDQPWLITDLEIS